LVCQYGPPGNYRGQFDKQVNGPVKSEASCQTGAGPFPPSPRRRRSAPRPTPVPGSCVDRSPTTVRSTCGKNAGKRLFCWQLMRLCPVRSYVRKQCCRTCSAPPAPKPSPTPAPAPGPMPPPTPVGQITQCGFEDAQLPYCKLWSQINSDQFDWSRGHRTPSCRTGPSRPMEGKRFLYIETSSPRRSGHKAVLRSERVSIGSGAVLSFNYHMYGRPGGLSVKVHSQTPTGKISRQVWVQRGNKGNSWKAATVSLKFYTGKDVQIDFVAWKGRGCGSYLGDIAIDNVVLNRGTSTKRRGKKLPPSPKPAPSPPPATKVPQQKVPQQYCVANMDRKSVTGPFASIATARKELNRRQGTLHNRQMICQMSANGAKRLVAQDGGAKAGFNKYWGGWADIHAMEKMCGDSKACAAAPTPAPTPATAKPTMSPTTMVPATPPTMRPSSNPSLPEAVKILTKRVNNLEPKIDAVLKKVLKKNRSSA